MARPGRSTFPRPTNHSSRTRPRQAARIRVAVLGWSAAEPPLLPVGGRATVSGAMMGARTSGYTADCAQGLTRWALLHPGHPVFSVRKRFDECHDPAKIQWYEGPAACERAISSDRQQQPVFRCAVCARSCISWTQHGPTTLTHKLALCGAHYGDLRQTGTKHTRTDRSEKGTPVNTRRHDDAALSDFQRRVSLSVWGASWSQASVCVLGTCVCIHTIIAPQCARRVRLVLLRRVPLC